MIAPGHSKWKIPFLIGIVVTLIAGFGYRLLFPTVDARTARLARIMNIAPYRQQRSEELRKEVRQAVLKNTELPEPEWHELLANFNDPNESLRIQTISTMMFLGNTKRRLMILGMVRPLLNESPMLQVSTLTLLWRFNDPSWRTEAQKRTNSQDKYLAQIASAMLEEGDMKK